MMNPNNGSHLNSAEIIAQVEARKKELDKTLLTTIKLLVKTLNSKKVELESLLVGDKEKYRRVSEELHSHDADWEKLEETNRQIRTYMASPEYSVAVLNEMLGMSVQKYFKQQRELKEPFIRVARELEGLQSDIDKASYMIQKMGEMEDGMLNLFSSEKRLDVEKITSSLKQIQKLIRDDKIPEL
ncbi:MAG: hypothetical protein LBI13_03990 [Streptococcaceae bacterium]|jgi:hypothetical protein|nr:hypothetical protein [Streptococcaceae bacterium]